MLLEERVPARSVSRSSSQPHKFGAASSTWILCQGRDSTLKNEIQLVDGKEKAKGKAYYL